MKSRLASPNVLCRFFNFLSALTLISFSLIFRPFLIIHFYPVEWQIGHLVSMTHANEKRNAEWNNRHRRKRLTIYCVSGPIANSYLIEKLREHIFLISGQLASMLNYLLHCVSFLRIYHPIDADSRDYHSANTLVTFTKDEVALGEAFLGNQRGEFVCLNIRDSSYNSMVRSVFNRNAKIWPHRNSDIRTYRHASQLLTSTGTAVYRMGVHVDRKFSEADPLTFDYATNGTRSEFLDLYLGYKCKFAISTSSGWDEIPFMFSRPVLLSNCADFLKVSNLTANCLIFPKIFLSSITKTILGFEEIVDLFQYGIRFLNGENLESFGVEIRDMSSEELVEAVTEMVQRVEGTFVETQEQKQMQAKLKHILSTHPKLQPSPNYFPIRAQFASCFLSRYPNFLDGLD